jgi:putative CocE/NonD family hydrolase
MIDEALTRRSFAKLLAGLAGAAGFGLSACRANEDTYDVALESDVMVPMRDGIRLATDVYRPARRGTALPGPFPVILERTPYSKNESSRSERTRIRQTPYDRATVAAYFVTRGYVVVYQDCRGTYRSEGGFTKYLSEAADGHDTVAWISEQPWCNGKVGTKGLSYAAHTQGALACLAPPGLAAMFLDSGGFSNAYQGGIRQGGAFEMKQATWAHRNALSSKAVQADSALRARLEAVDVRSWFARLPWTSGHSPVSLVPEYESYLFEQWTHGTFDDYWKQPGLWAAGCYDRYADVPMVHMSSWYDPYPRTATDNYLGLKASKRGPVKLILGPWTHGDRSLTFAGDVDFGTAAAIDGDLAEDFLALRLRWFDRWLRGIRNGVDRDPAVRLFLMGGGSGRRNAEGRLDHGGHWRWADDWQVPGTRFQPYHLRADGRLTADGPAAGESPRRFAYDPRDPVPTIGGAITSGQPVMVGGAFDQREEARFFGSRAPYRPLAERPDVLVFQTEPLEAAVDLIGPISAVLWIASDCPDTDFTAKLIDVYPPSADYPDGFAMNLTDGILRVRYRDSWEHPALMEPGRVYRVTIDAFPTANRFAVGHRIRLDVSSSNYPHFDINPNTGEPEGAWKSTRVARNTVFMDADRPSHVLLPVTPQPGPR